MIDANTGNQNELDQGALLNDVRAGERAMKAVYNFIGRFVSYPSEHARVAHALWIAHAHIIDRFDTTPRLSFISPEPMSGKSRALEVSELLVPNPVMTINASAAYIFRKVADQQNKPTILFDEIDAIFGEKAGEHEDLRSLLNAGYRRGQSVGRCIAVGKGIITEEFPAFSAVALAGLGQLPDTIKTRSVIVRMRPRKSDEKVEPFRRRLHVIEGDRVRSMVEIWAASVPPNIAEYPELPAGIVDRAADVWEPLLTVAHIVGGEWPARGRSAALALLKVADDFEPSLGLLLLRHMRDVFEDRDYLATSVITGKLLNMEEAPWGNPWERNPPRPLDGHGLAKLLKAYSIRPQIRREGSAVLRGYARKDFEDAWARYPGESVTPVTAKQSPPNKGNGVSPVTPVTPFPGVGRRTPLGRPALGPAGDDLGDFQ